ncbi:hypothetical protein HYU20_03405 [Candidatus Woesearchaeota archaeon]|nr:hypothetical protein [Candidatus Woesearchaeota archaeon]
MGLIRALMGKSWEVAAPLQEHMQTVVDPLNELADKLGDPHGVRLESNGRNHSVMPKEPDLHDIFAFYWHLKVEGEILAEMQYRPSGRAYRDEEYWLGELNLFRDRGMRSGEVWEARNYALDRRLVLEGSTYVRTLDRDCVQEATADSGLSDIEKRTVQSLVEKIKGGVILTERVDAYYYDPTKQVNRKTISPVILQAAYLTLRARLVAAQKFEQKTRPLKDEAFQWALEYLQQNRGLLKTSP